MEEKKRGALVGAKAGVQNKFGRSKTWRIKTVWAEDLRDWETKQAGAEGTTPCKRGSSAPSKKRKLPGEE